MSHPVRRTILVLSLAAGALVGTASPALAADSQSAPTNAVTHSASGGSGSLVDLHDLVNIFIGNYKG